MNKRTNRIVSIILGMVLLATACIVPIGANANEESQKPVLKILAIGNSYTNNATQYISKIAESMGLDIKTAVWFRDISSVMRPMKNWVTTHTMLQATP